MSIDLILKPQCGGCGSTSDLYGSNCKHMTLCLSCGKRMAETHAKCSECGTPITRLIREYNVRTSSSSEKNYFIGRFLSGLPVFSRKKNGEVRWTIHKEGTQGRQISDALREKLKNRPWVLEDETGQFQYQGQHEGAQNTTYYLLMMHGKEFVAFPAVSWYNFNKVAQYKQLTLEEAEEKMKNRKKNADGYQRWMMKAAANGPAAFGEVEKLETIGTGRGSDVGARQKKTSTDDEDGVVGSDKGDEGEEEEARKPRLKLNNKGADDDEEGPRGGDLDMDDDDIEKGDDWEHEEIFTDDDEAVGHDPEEREDLAPDAPAPPEIKQDEEDEDEGDEEEEGLSKSGKELNKLLRRVGGLNESADEDEDDDDDELEDEAGLSPALAPKNKETLKEQTDVTPTKPVPSRSTKGTPSPAKSKAKRKPGTDDVKPASAAVTKKMKTENESRPSALVKDASPTTSKSVAAIKVPGQMTAKIGGTAVTSAVTEEEVRNALLQLAPVTTQELVGKFKARLRTSEDKAGFAAILKKISRIQKSNGANFVVLREK